MPQSTTYDIHLLRQASSVAVSVTFKSYMHKQEKQLFS